ncbi:MAG: NTP transferase domain-containing protein [Gordonibacter sp.]|uniref:NTP transferase domain-containing protein n=1 Tax=Gordonibacter sp. TaxID=1968902 RepID=UPI002FC794D2
MGKSLDLKEFKILTMLESQVDCALTQREIAAKAGLSVGTVNHAMVDLHDRGYVREGALTAVGLEALEPYRVRRAVLIAAGFGSRLVPITLNTPKPLARVNGRRIIDSLLDAVQAAGIEEVYVVRGYLAEQFDQLLYQYPNIKFIENPIYNEANNISSTLAAKDVLANAYVFESDLLLYSPKLITKYQYASNYLGVPVERTDDWCFQTRRGVITGLTVGGTDCHHMFGISYWTEEDGKKLAQDIPATFAMPGGMERYWDEVALRYFADRYEVRVRECSFDDVIEIDTFRELQELDEAYR